MRLLALLLILLPGIALAQGQSVCNYRILMPPEPDLESCTASFQVSGTTHDFNFVAGPPEYSFDVCSTPLFLEGAVTCAASCVDTSGNRSQEVGCPANTFPNLAPSLPEILLDPNG